MKRARKRIVATVIALTAGFMLASAGMAAERPYLMGTSSTGTAGYASTMGFTSLISKYTPYKLEAVPTPGSTATARLFGKKGCDFAYISAFDMSLAYDKKQPFAEPPLQRNPYQGMYYALVRDHRVDQGESERHQQIPRHGREKGAPERGGLGMAQPLQGRGAEDGLLRQAPGAVHGADAGCGCAQDREPGGRRWIFHRPRGALRRLDQEHRYHGGHKTRSPRARRSRKSFWPRNSRACSTARRCPTNPLPRAMRKTRRRRTRTASGSGGRTRGGTRARTCRPR